MDKEQYLFIATIGPVQSFIAQARKNGDLNAGSFLLSHLSKYAIESASKYGGNIIMPSTQNKGTPNRFVAIFTATKQETKEIAIKIENETRGEFRRLAKEIIDNLEINLTGDYESTFNNQIDSFLQFFWAAEVLPNTTSEAYRKAYISLMFKLGAAKSLRSFSPLNEEGSRKCSVSYEYNAIFARNTNNRNKNARSDRYRNLITVSKFGNKPPDKYLRANETLGAIAFVKRCMAFAKSIKINDEFESIGAIAIRWQLNQLKDILEVQGKTDMFEFIEILKKEPDSLFNDSIIESRQEIKYAANIIKEELKKNKITISPYYAIVQFDGDDMGHLYSDALLKEGVHLKDFQQHLSKSISTFADSVSGSFSNKPDIAQVIYAGGEDFLGLFNIAHVFEELGRLHKDFSKIDLSNYTEGRTLTFSAGVVISHYKTPLQEVLHHVRQAEHTAKEFYPIPEKSSYCVKVLKHSGEIHEFTHKFNYYYDNDIDTLQSINSLIDLMSSDEISTGFIYQLIREFWRITASEDDNLKDMVLSEMRRLLKSSKANDKAITEIDSLITGLMYCFENKDISKFFYMLEIVAFVARQKGAAE